MVESCRWTLEKPSAYRRNMRYGGLKIEERSDVRIQFAQCRLKLDRVDKGDTDATI